MERPKWKQEELWPELWPKKMSPEELRDELDKINDEFRRAGNYTRRKKEDVIPDKPARILSRKENAKRARELLEKLEK